MYPSGGNNSSQNHPGYPGGFVIPGQQQNQPQNPGGTQYPGIQGGETLGIPQKLLVLKVLTA